MRTPCPAVTGCCGWTQRAVPQAQLPLVHTVDMRKHKLEDGLAPPVMQALQANASRAASKAWYS